MKKSIFISIIILIILLIGFAFAFMVETLKGNGYFLVAKPIYETSVEEVSSDNSLYSYYNVKIRNYNANNEISMVDFDYEITLGTSDNSQIPDYYWLDQNGNIIGQKLEGSLGKSTEEEKTYKICFLNSGNEAKTADVKFVATATQKNDNEWIDADITAITGLIADPVSNVTLTITGPEQNGMQLDAKPYSFDGGTTWQELNSKTYNQNTEGIVVKVKDSNGKIYVHPKFNITNIQ